jgi:hypothetical protein
MFGPATPLSSPAKRHIIMSGLAAGALRDPAGIVH